MSERVEVLEIDLTDIQQEAEETGKTLKDLRKEVKELRSQLESTEVGTEDFAKTLDKLTRKQQELTNVTKSGVKAQKGSYNDLVNQMALLKKEWRAAADESERAAIGQKIGAINARLKELDASLGNYQRNVGNYQGEMHELATDLDAVSGAASSAAPKLESYNSEVSGLSKSTEGLTMTSSDWVQTAENTVKVTAGITGAFQAAQGAINLMGIESEATTEMIAKMQNVMAITEGLKAISEGIESFGKLKDSVQGASIMAKLFGTETEAMTVATNAQTVATTGATVATNTFKKALIATGIGAIVVLIGTLIAKWEDLKEALGFAKEEQEEVNEALEESIEREKERKRVINDSVGSVLGKYKLLQRQWQELSDVQEKNEWIKKNADAFDDLGFSINDVNTAQSVFITNSEAVIKAIKDQARARAMSKLYEEAIAQQYTAQQELNDAKITAEQKYYSGYKPTDEEAEKAGLDDYDYESGVIEENPLIYQWFGADKYEYNATSENVDYGGARKLQNTYLRPFQQSVDAINGEVAKLEEAFIEAEQTAAESAAAVQELGINYQPTGGSGGSGSGGSTTSTDDWAERLKAFYAERAKILQELNHIEFDALQSQRTDQYDIEIEELKRAKEQEIATLDEYFAIKLKNEKTGEEYSLITQEEYDKAKLELETIYGKRIAEVEKSRLEELNRIAKERLDAINERFQDAIQTANTQYEISSATATAVGDEVTNARALQTLLDAQNQALVTKRDELLAYKSELGETSEEIAAINAELEVVTNEMAMNAHNRTMAIAAEKAAQLELINEIVGSVSDSMDQLLALDLGSKWSDELGMAFSAIQDGISQTSDALKSGQKGWQAYGQMAAAGLNAAAGILNSIAEKQDEESKEGFEKQKKLQIAAATMAMLGGVVSAITSAFNPANAWMTIWGQAAAAAAMSALTITTGAIQIANIKKQTLDGGGGSESPVIPSLSALNAMGTPVAATTNIEGASTEGVTTDTRVYVLESDISNSQNDVKTTVAEATF
jgi:chromosome segregation ATPase